MAGPKGKSNNPAGRPRGVPNKATQDARAAIGHFVEANTPRLNALLDEIHIKEGPLAAFNCIRDLLEYHVPKLARVDHGNADGKSFKVEWPVARSPLDD